MTLPPPTPMTNLAPAAAASAFLIVSRGSPAAAENVVTS